MKQHDWDEWQKSFWNNIKKWTIEDLSFKQLEQAYKIAHVREKGTDCKPGIITPKEQEMISDYRLRDWGSEGEILAISRSTDPELLAHIHKTNRHFEELEREEKHQDFLKLKAEKDKEFESGQEKIRLRQEAKERDRDNILQNTLWMLPQAKRWMLMSVVSEPDFVCGCGSTPHKRNHMHRFLNVTEHLHFHCCMNCRRKLVSIKKAPTYLSLSEQAALARQEIQTATVLDFKQLTSS